MPAIDEFNEEMSNAFAGTAEEYKNIMNEYIENLYNNELDKSSVLGKAIKYSMNIKNDLYRFFNDGHIPLTNNLSDECKMLLN